MIDSFKVVLQALKSMDPGMMASIAGVVINVFQWKQQRMERSQDARLDDYLEYLRRKNHEQIVELIMDNRQHFETMFDATTSQVAMEIRTLTTKLTQFDISPQLLGITVMENLTKAQSVKTSDWQEVPFRMQLTIVNRHVSRVTLTRATISCEGPDGGLKLSFNRPAKIEGGGDSETIMLESAGKGQWREGETIIYRPKPLVLQIDQHSSPLQFTFQDGAIVPDE